MAMGLSSRGFSGGLAILSNPSKVQLTNFSTNMWWLSTNFKILGSKAFGNLTNVYGPTNPLEKMVFLNSFDDIPPRTPNNLQIIRGNYNLFTSIMKKKGGINRLDDNNNRFSKR